MADIDTFTSYVQSKLDTVIAAAETATDDLTAIAEGNLASFTFAEPPEYDASVPIVDFTPSNVTMDAVEPFNAPVMDALEAITAPVAATIDPIDYTRADAAILGFDPQSFDPSSISGEITDLATRVLSLMDDGGPGISEAVQTALMDKTRERDLQVLDDALLRVRSSDAMNGFPFPNSMTQAAQNELTKKWQDAYTDRSRDILALMTERAHATAMAALNAGISLTQIKSGLQDSVWKLYYSMQALVLDEFKTFVGAEETRVKTELAKVLGDYEIYKTRLLTDSNVKLEVFKALASGEEVRLRAETTLATAKAEIDLKSNDNLLKTAAADAEGQIKKWVATLDNLTQRGVANINQIASADAKRVAGAQSQAEYYKGIIIALTQMVNTLQTKKVT